jgi:hypothetical protein
VSGVRVMIGRLRSAKVNHAVTFSAHSQFISLTCKTGYPNHGRQLFTRDGPEAA